MRGYNTLNRMGIVQIVEVTTKMTNDTLVTNPLLNTAFLQNKVSVDMNKKVGELSK